MVTSYNAILAETTPFNQTVMIWIKKIMFSHIKNIGGYVRSTELTIRMYKFENLVAYIEVGYFNIGLYPNVQGVFFITV